MQRLRTFVTCLFALVAFAVFPAAFAANQGAPATRAIVPVPYNKDTPALLSVSVDRHELKIGETVTVCFEASRDGYVTLWNISTEGVVARIFPNAHTPAGPGTMQAKGGQRRCAGENGDAYRFRVDGPPGLEDLYLLWTSRPELQPATASYSSAETFTNELRRLGAAGGDQWGVAKTSYDIVPVTGSVPPQLPEPSASGQVTAPATPSSPAPAAAPVAPQSAPKPPKPTSTDLERGRIVILSMGANVAPLTKTNQDALIFAAVMGKMFNVKRDDILFIENARRRDFVKGMSWLQQRTRPQDVAIVYYSGHGARIEDPNGTSADGYEEAFVPFDVETNPNPSISDLVLAQEFAKMVNALPTENVITVVDACHSAGLYRSLESAVVGAKSKLYTPPRGVALTLPAQAQTRGLANSGRIKAKGILLSAAKREQSALEGPNGGIFTLALLEEMVTMRSGSMTTAFQRAADRVNQATRGRQSPQAIGGAAPSNMLAVGR